MKNYDAFAQTFSNSRKNMHWPEVDAIIADMKAHDLKSVLDIGCGNGRFLEFWQGDPQNYLGIDESLGMITEAQKLHPEYRFVVEGMETLGDHPTLSSSNYSAILFLASFHHLKTRGARIQTLKEARKLLAPHGTLYMTNWNLLDQPRYESNHRGNGDFDIKIGAYTRYYHGFTLDELGEIFHETGWNILENRIFEGGRNLYTKATL